MRKKERGNLSKFQKVFVCKKWICNIQFIFTINIQQIIVQHEVHWQQLKNKDLQIFSILIKIYLMAFELSLIIAIQSFFFHDFIP
jgi:hypothetical protein